MTTHSLTLSPHEVLAALRGGLGLIVRPVRPTVKGCKVGAYTTQTPNGLHVEPVNVQEDGDPWDDIPCPFGAPGIRLVGKETWCCPIDTAPQTTVYRADYPDCVPSCYENIPQPAALSWRSPATMPAWASRITLEVEGVRVCRLHQLCEDDMRKAYGISMATPASGELYRQLRTSFEAVWDKHYGRRYPWESNPWCWAVKVRRDDNAK